MKRAAPIIIVLTLFGCRSEGEPRTFGPPRGGEEVLVAALGDSITAGYPLWNPSPRIRDVLPAEPDRRSQYQYWARRHLGRHVRFRNCGYNGARTDQLRRVLGDCARAANTLIVQGGLNDLIQRRPPAAVARDLRAMVRRGKALGLRVAITELLPVSGPWVRLVPMIRDLNRRIHRLARGERVPVLGWHSALEDPRRRGRMRSEFTTDGAHPSIAGYRRLGESIKLP